MLCNGRIRSFIKPDEKRRIQKILVVATGALLSPLTFQQEETIPCIAHAVSIEFGGATQ